MSKVNEAKMIKNAISYSTYKRMKESGSPPYADGRYALCLGSLIDAPFSLKKQPMPDFLKGAVEKFNWQYLGETEYCHVFRAK
jgi:hypothetical protein